MTNIDVIRQVYAAFAAGDIPTFLSFLDSGIAWHPAEGHPYASNGAPWVGKEALVRDFLQRIGPDWQGFSTTPHRLHDAGDVIVAEGRYGGPTTRPGTPSIRNSAICGR